MGIEEQAKGELRLIPARKGVAERVKAGQTVTVINTHGSQVVDSWAADGRPCRHSSQCVTCSRPGCSAANRRSSAAKITEDGSRLA